MSTFKRVIYTQAVQMSKIFLAALALINFNVLFVISVFHFYWAIGKDTGFAKTVPTDHEGNPVLIPTKMSCIVVGLLLQIFAFLFLTRANLLFFPLSSWILHYIAWGISGIFLFRAIGDFNYVGFTKRITTTDFAKMDTLYYSPLCLLLGLDGLLIELLR
jgi:hypothetical protein